MRPEPAVNGGSVAPSPAPQQTWTGRVGLGVASLALLLAGCGAPVRPDLPAASPPAVTASVPSDGVSLRSIGFTNGPVDAFSLPRTIAVSTRVDEASGVTVVISTPSAEDVAGYLRRTLPETGFTVTADQPADDAAPALTFTGYGWHGSFTGSGSSSALILRP